MKNKPIIQLKNVNFSYVENVQILKNININIYENEYVCIIGHNGSGKSTVSKILSGLLKPQSGEILLLDKLIDYKNIKLLRNNIGVVFQNPDNQFVGLAVEDDIAFGLENRKYPSERMNDVIKLSAQALDITNLLDKNAEQLSGGQKQKVAIAGILAINPKIIIFDESTSMLDPKSKKEIKKLMLDLKNIAKKTIVSITHDMEEVKEADRIIFINKGEVAYDCSPKDLFLNNKSLKSLQLDYPFILKLSNKLNELGMNIEPTLNEREFLNQWKK